VALRKEDALREKRVNELKRRVQRSLALRRWAIASEEMKELVVLEPYNSDFQLTLGLLFRQTGNVDEARRKYQDFRDLGGHPAVAHLLIAEAYAAKNDKTKAFQHLKKAAENGMNILKAVEQYKTLTPYRNDTEFIKLALKLERYDLDLAGRVDPTTNKFRKPAVDEVGEPTIQESGRLSKEDQEKRLRHAKHYLANIERFLSLENEEKAMEAYGKLLETTEDIDKFTVPALAAAMRDIIGKKEIIEARIEEIRLRFYFQEAKQVIAKMQREFQNEDYPRVIALRDELALVSRAMTSVNPDFQQVAKKVTLVGSNWVRKAEIRREFLKKTMHIEGIITHQGAPMAIVNNRLLRIGQPFQDMTVVKIEPNQIYFDYKGERIPLVFRRY
jgi:tetratricopeptide (TPR) repeat protein